MYPSFSEHSSTCSYEFSSRRLSGFPAEPPLLPGAIYLRLSKDDEGSGESLSIANQRKMLQRYAAEHHLPIVREYVDDGYSGTSFERPGFKKMIEDIEKKEIGLILTKDLSRLGRDYIKTGQYTELFFPSRGVRFIAVGDGYDSAFSSTDLIPFRNVVNEMYARDISRKIKASLQVRMEEGSYIGSFAPYGYRKSNGKHHRLLPDPETAPVVQNLFLQAAVGVFPSALAAGMNAQKVLCPLAYRCRNHPNLDPARYGNAGKWTANTIIKILHNPVYLGHMVQGKTKKLSFKSKTTLSVPEEERIIVPNTHPPIITEELFRQCEEQLEKRATRKKRH